MRSYCVIALRFHSFPNLIKSASIRWRGDCSEIALAWFGSHKKALPVHLARVSSDHLAVSKKRYEVLWDYKNTMIRKKQYFDNVITEKPVVLSSMPERRWRELLVGNGTCGHDHHCRGDSRCLVCW
ncbi:hypothetical protein CEXT_360031 [Caerostris extrusa]|uniref:Uncharacterized protein n=1 Tax=Caerostris extrusa TaxID=172846 RepID=A0AAV4YCS3_CAEEX|nr:hypothetical protein CEXT_360031 [Caerostris extrusa]